MKTGKKIIVLIVLVFVFLPVFAHAVSWWPLVPCGTSANPTECTRCDLFKLFKNIIDFVLYGLMPPVAAIRFVWGGFLILMGGANPGLISKGKTIFWNTFMGVLILSSSWLITNTIIKSLATEDIANSWYQFECRETVGGGGGGGGGGEKKYSCQNNTCVESSTGTHTEPTCNNECETPPGDTLSISTSALPDGTISINYSTSLSATGGATPYTWSVSTGNLPAGLNLSSSGTISGTPTATGTSTFTVKAEDSSTPKKSATKQLSIVVATQANSVVISNVASSNITNTITVITWTTDKPSTSQVAYGTTIAYGSDTYLNSDQVTNHSVTITGLSPGTTYNYQAVSSITGFIARSSNNTFKTTGTTVQPLAITTSSLPDATQGTAYSQAVSATGGIAPYTWSVSSSNLPAGLNLSGSGTISGTPTATGTSTFTVKAEDSSTPKKSATKQLSIVVNQSNEEMVCRHRNATPPMDNTTNLCQPRSMTCGASACNQYVSAINQYAGRTGVSNGANFLKAIMIKESACNVGAQSGSSPPSCGLMQLKASTANQYKSKCGISVDTTCDWLKKSENANASICIAAEFMKALTQTSCGSTPRGVSAGYNGGSGACNNSVDCAGETSCAGGPVKRWECWYDNPQHTRCNDGYNETRDYATKVLYCYNNPGF